MKERQLYIENITIHNAGSSPHLADQEKIEKLSLIVVNGQQIEQHIIHVLQKQLKYLAERKTVVYRGYHNSQCRKIGEIMFKIL